MLIKRSALEELEVSSLAPYAMKSKDTRGRDYSEPEHEYRTIYQRDRDRIIHSTAFRRLEYKTQVFVNHEGDYYRTRLTHTMEVAQISRTIARTLRLNEELTEAIALAHDIGHTPFGHSGEEALHELMREAGGFEHNAQGLRVVEKLEKKYPSFEGLNLSWEVREGIIKHKTPYDNPLPGRLNPDEAPLLEAQVINLADEIAYTNHDIDDGLTAGLITESQLESVPLWKKLYAKNKKLYPSLDRERLKYVGVKELINSQVIDLLEETTKRLKSLKVKSVEDVRRETKPIVSFSPEMEKENSQLKGFLLAKLYHHYRVIRMADKGKRFIKGLFEAYTNCPGQLPPSVQKRGETESLPRAICDYIAGMTDRYASEEYAKLFGPFK